MHSQTNSRGASLGPVDVETADEAFFLSSDDEYFTRTGGRDYGTRDFALQIYERHGRVIIISSLSGSCCAYGYSNTETVTDYTPTLAQLTSAMDVLRPVVLNRLRDLQLV